MANFAASDGTQIYEKVWNASGTPIGSVVLIHGFGEHIGRYEHVAAAVTAGGFHVRGSDLRGHGQSGGPRGHCERFSDYLDDTRLLIARAREASPNLPLLVLAHSFGGLIATKLGIERPEGIDAMVLSSPFYAVKLKVPMVKVVLGKMMSGIYGKLAQPNGLKGTDATRDTELAATYDKDPLNQKVATARWFTETMAAQEALPSTASRFTLPVLVRAAGDDRLVDVAVTEKVFPLMGSTDKTLEVLPGQYHEIFNEPGDAKNVTLQRVVTWLKQHAAASSGKLRASGA
jgi:lysophospholipase